MNLVGKIFVFLILVASTVFMTMALMVYATHRNLEEEILGSKEAGGTKVGYKEELKKAYQEKADLLVEIERLKTTAEQENRAHAEQLAKAETELNVLEQRNIKLEADGKELQVRLATSTTALKAAQDNLSSLRAEAAKLREDIRLANQATDEQLKKATDLEDKLHVALSIKKDLANRNEQLAQLVAKAKILLTKWAPAGTTIEDRFDNRAPTIRGEILALDKEDHAEISLGSDDGLREGHTLEVFRGDKYLGRMEVLDIHPHRAVGKVLKDYQQDVIRKGDSVATWLKS